MASFLFILLSVQPAKGAESTNTTKQEDSALACEALPEHAAPLGVYRLERSFLLELRWNSYRLFLDPAKPFAEGSLAYGNGTLTFDNSTTCTFEVREGHLWLGVMVPLFAEASSRYWAGAQCEIPHSRLGVIDHLERRNLVVWDRSTDLVECESTRDDCSALRRWLSPCRRSESPSLYGSVGAGECEAIVPTVELAGDFMGRRARFEACPAVLQPDARAIRTPLSVDLGPVGIVPDLTVSPTAGDWTAEDGTDERLSTVIGQTHSIDEGCPWSNNREWACGPSGLHWHSGGDGISLTLKEHNCEANAMRQEFDYWIPLSDSRAAWMRFGSVRREGVTLYRRSP